MDIRQITELVLDLGALNRVQNIAKQCLLDDVKNETYSRAWPSTQQELEFRNAMQALEFCNTMHNVDVAMLDEVKY